MCELGNSHRFRVNVFHVCIEIMARRNCRKSSQVNFHLSKREGVCEDSQSFRSRRSVKSNVTDSRPVAFDF